MSCLLKVGKKRLWCLDGDTTSARSPDRGVMVIVGKDLFGAEPFDPFTCGAADFPPDIQSKLDEMQVSRLHRIPPQLCPKNHNKAAHAALVVRWLSGSLLCSFQAD